VVQLADTDHLEWSGLRPSGFDSRRPQYSIRRSLACATMPLVAKKPKNTEKKKAKPGPKAEVLKLEGDWRDNIRKSFQAKKPVTGWPK